MREHLNEGARVWLRTLDVHEVPDLWTLQPHRVNAGHHGAHLHSINEGLEKASEWYGAVTRPQLEALLTTGWPEGAARAKGLADRFRDTLPQPASRKRTRVWADQGDDLDRDRVLAGNLDLAWRRTVRRTVAAPQTVTVALPWAHHAGVRADDLFWGGAAALAVTDLLEQAGYSVELQAVLGSESAGHRSVTVVAIKAPGDPLRPDAVAGVFCHAATFRVHGILSVWGAPFNMGSGAGMPLRPDRALQGCVDAGLPAEVPQVCIAQSYSESAARASVEQALKQLTGEAVAA